MNNPIKKTLLLLIAISSFIAMSGYDCLAAAKTGKWKAPDSDIWISGTMRSEYFIETVVEGKTYITTADYWHFCDTDDKPIAHGDKPITMEYSSGKGGGTPPSSESDTTMHKVSSIIFNGETLEINSTEQLDASIYELNGRKIYSTNGSSIVVDKNKFSNGQYMLRLEDKEGKAKVKKLMFINGEFIISE